MALVSAQPAGDPLATAPATPLLHVADVHKRYGGVRALRGAHLTVSGRGVVHGLIGANGSGKSTLLNILSGQRAPDAGRIVLDGAEVHLASPQVALRHGIAMVAQETALAPTLSIAENVLMGRLIRRPVTGIDWGGSRRRAGELLRTIGVDEDPALPVGRLRPDRQQMVEIARALSLDARILILDEPTSALNDDEVAQLFAAVRGLRAHGVSTIFVSHRLGELLSLCDELTVLRDGETVAEGPVADFDADRIVAEMVPGTARWSQRTRAPRTFRADGPPALAVRGLSVAGALDGVDLEVERGEVVGLAGMVGAGRSELLEAIFGARTADAGTIELDGRPLRLRDARDAIRQGLGYVPPDRKQQGVVLTRSVHENLALVATRDAGLLRRPGRARERALVRETIDTMHIVAASPQVPVSTLSGGNQQKVALGRWIAARSRVLLLDEPTRGVDVAAKAEIHALLRQAAADGAALLVSSSEADELLDLCDRIVVLFRGRVVASIPTEEASEETLARYAGGHL